jgi:photosystem II stability/assembly factor-like uncharacterized protein
VDVQTVWQCGIRNIAVSTDSGQTWENSEGAGGRNCIVSFADAETGWIYGLLRLNATTDGGQTWEEVELPERIDIVALSLRTADDGYMLSEDGVLYTTQDGGKSWSSIQLDVGEYGEMMLAPSDFPTAAIRFFDADNGVIVLSLVGGGRSSVVALRTMDGGETWTSESVVSGDAGVLYLTRDAKFLTVHSLLEFRRVTVFEYKGF